MFFQIKKHFFCVCLNVTFNIIGIPPLFSSQNKLDLLPEGAAASRHTEPDSQYNMVSSTFL